MTHTLENPIRLFCLRVDVEHLPQSEHVLPVASMWNIILYPPFVFKVASSVINTEHCPSSDEILAPLWAIVDRFFFFLFFLALRVDWSQRSLILVSQTNYKITICRSFSSTIPCLLKYSQILYVNRDSFQGR